MIYVLLLIASFIAFVGMLAFRRRPKPDTPRRTDGGDASGAAFHTGADGDRGADGGGCD